MRVLGFALLASIVLTLAVPARVRAEIRISDIDVYLNGQEVAVHVVVLGIVPPSFGESIESGIPTQVRYTIQLWRYNRFWPDRLLASKVIERTLRYNVVAREFTVASLHGETASAYTTKDLREAQRMLSEVASLELTPASILDPADVFYVRVRVESALRGENTLLTRMSGTAEQASRRSDYRTLMRGR